MNTNVHRRLLSCYIFITLSATLTWDGRITRIFFRTALQFTYSKSSDLTAMANTYNYDKGLCLQSLPFKFGNKGVISKLLLDTSGCQYHFTYYIVFMLLQFFWYFEYIPFELVQEFNTLKHKPCILPKRLTLARSLESINCSAGTKGAHLCFGWSILCAFAFLVIDSIKK